MQSGIYMANRISVDHFGKGAREHLHLFESDACLLPYMQGGKSTPYHVLGDILIQYTYWTDNLAHLPIMTMYIQNAVRGPKL